MALYINFVLTGAKRCTPVGNVLGCGEMEYPTQMIGLDVMGVGSGFTAAALASNLQLMKVYPLNANFARISLSMHGISGT